MDKYFTWIHYERLHNHNIAKHNKTVCIFLGICCSYLPPMTNKMFAMLRWDHIRIGRYQSYRMVSFSYIIIRLEYFSDRNHKSNNLVRKMLPCERISQCTRVTHNIQRNRHIKNAQSKSTKSLRAIKAEMFKSPESESVKQMLLMIRTACSNNIWKVTTVGIIIRISHTLRHTDPSQFQMSSTGYHLDIIYWIFPDCLLRNVQYQN